MNDRAPTRREPDYASSPEFSGALPDVVLIFDAEGRYLKALARDESLLVERPGKLEGTPVQDILPPPTAELCLSVIRETVGSGREQTVEYRLETLDGWKWFEGRTSLLPETRGEPRKVLLIARDITDRKTAEAAARDALRQKDLLLKELYHRLNNNLQLIISLLKLQSKKIADPETRNLLRRNRDRIASMALVHEILYRSRDLSRVDFGRYLRTLAAYVFEQYSLPPEAVRLETEIDDVAVDINTAIPCGLILNELLAGSIDAGDSGPPRGTIRIGLKKKTPGRLEISFSRRGENFPRFPVGPGGDSFELELVRILAEQLGADLSAASGDRETWKMVFPLSDNRTEGEDKLWERSGS